MMPWLLLVLTLPTRNASARMRAWRALKAAGAVVLRDGVYLLPAGAGRHDALAAIARDIEAAGGSAWLFEAGGADCAALFDRTPDYGRLALDVAVCRNELDRLAPAEWVRRSKRLRRAFAALVAVDFFPGPAQTEAAAQLDELDAAIRTRMAPAEPTAAVAVIRARDPAAYQHRLWATRKRPWADRLASAWLIRRFIDDHARFIWLDDPGDCPAGALGFDFDGAEFSHVGDRVTFETLLASFGLDADPGLVRLAGVIHYLDVGGLPAPESAGLEALLGGMHATFSDDDALLEAASGAFDYLYSALKDAP